MARSVGACSRRVAGGSIETVLAEEKLVCDSNLVDKRVDVVARAR